METKKKLEESLREAMRAANDTRKRTIRMALSNIKNAEIDKGSPLDDLALLQILQKELKSRKESILDAQKANRPDLISGLEAEIKVIEEFLPQPLDENAVRELVAETIAEISATGPGDMGKVVKSAMSKAQGRASGDQISRAAKELLQK